MIAAAARTADTTHRLHSVPGIFFFGVIHSVYQISEREKDGGKRKERTTKWRRTMREANNLQNESTAVAAEFARELH